MSKINSLAFGFVFAASTALANPAKEAPVAPAADKATPTYETKAVVAPPLNTPDLGCFAGKSKDPFKRGSISDDMPAECQPLKKLTPTPN